VAFVVAETVEAGRDAAEALPIDWEPEPATVGIDGAEAGRAPLVWPEAQGNIAFDCREGDWEATDTAFARAARTVSLTLVNNRLVTNYMETRACIGEYEAETRRWTLTLGSQGPHAIRDTLAAAILKVEPERVRVITPDVGGGFGTKLFMFREYPLSLIAAERVGRPVRWTAERTEHFLGDAQGRDNLTTLDMALDGEGRFLAMRVDLKADIGSYLSSYAPYIPTAGSLLSPGVYDIPAVAIRIRGYYTHTLPVDAYRGAGRPEAAYAVERLVDHIARETGDTPDAVRSRNFVRPQQMPTRARRVSSTTRASSTPICGSPWSAPIGRLRGPAAESERAGKLRG
jgi:carbon-monoxide dehydrogenase large subunit